MQAFLSYAHNDYSDFRTFMSHMMSIRRAYSVEIWADNRIHAGYGWSKAIEDAINSSSIFILLASPSFFESAYIYGTEIPVIRERRIRSGALVIPVVVKRCYWQILSGILQAVPTKDGHVKPIVDWRPTDNGHDCAREQIATAIGSHVGRPPQAIEWDTR
jgi:TIR domain